MEEDEGLFKKMKRMFSGEKEQDDAAEEIISMVDEGHVQGVFEECEARMIRNIFEYADKDAKDIMTHRKNIIAIDGEEKLSDALMFILEQNYSRFPVYENDIDNIIGIVHMRDVMNCYMDKALRETPIKELQLLNREVSFIPERKSIDSLFKKMQAEQNHIAIVIDEYGQTKGLVAMEDILEEIVGNILDEYDEEEELVIPQQDGSYLVKGMNALDDIEDLLHINFEEEEFDTLNGFLISKLERIPAPGEDCIVRYGGYQFHILAMENNMIHTVNIRKEEA